MDYFFLKIDVKSCRQQQFIQTVLCCKNVQKKYFEVDDDLLSHICVLERGDLEIGPWQSHIKRLLRCEFLLESIFPNSSSLFFCIPSFADRAISFSPDTMKGVNRTRIPLRQISAVQVTWVVPSWLSLKVILSSAVMSSFSPSSQTWENSSQAQVLQISLDSLPLKRLRTSYSVPISPGTRLIILQPMALGSQPVTFSNLLKCFQTWGRGAGILISNFRSTIFRAFLSLWGFGCQSNFLLLFQIINYSDGKMQRAFKEISCSRCRKNSNMIRKNLSCPDSRNKLRVLPNTENKRSSGLFMIFIYIYIIFTWRQEEYFYGILFESFQKKKQPSKHKYNYNKQNLGHTNPAFWESLLLSFCSKAWISLFIFGMMLQSVLNNSMFLFLVLWLIRILSLSLLADPQPLI